MSREVDEMTARIIADTERRSVRVAEVRPGDRVTFGDHTGEYRVRRISRHCGVCGLTTVWSWWRRRRVELDSTRVWLTGGRER